MAVTTVHVTTLTANELTADPTGTPIVHANTHVVTPPGPLEEIVLRVTNTTNAEKVVTVVAGDDPPASEACFGDLVLSMSDGDPTPDVQWIGPLSSARFVQHDGTVHITVEADMTGYIEAFSVPRNA